MSWQADAIQMASDFLMIADLFQEIADRLRGDEPDPEVFEAVHDETVIRW